MRPFELLRPSSVDEALAALAEHGGDAAPMAGGQSLLLELKERARAPRVVVSLGRLGELVGHRNGAGLTIGATTTYRSLAADPPAGTYSGLGAVVGDIADRPVRTMATVGGALCQADPRFDLPVVACALDAEVGFRAQTGSRTVPAGEFVVGPGATARRPDELLTEVRFPERGENFRWSFQKIRLRAMDAAMVSVGIALEVRGSTVDGARVVVGACTEIPTRLQAVEEALNGHEANVQLVEEVAKLSGDSVEVVERPWPYLDPAYLRHVVSVLVERGLAHVLFGTDQPQGV